MKAEFELMDTVAHELQRVTQERDHYRARCQEQEIQISELLRELRTDRVIQRNKEWLDAQTSPSPSVP